MKKIGIVDDLKSDRDTLAQIVSRCLTQNKLQGELACFGCGEEFLDAFVPGEFSVVFLDILMGQTHMSGMDTAKKIRETDLDLLLVFTTTEEEFALEGYSVQAMDYLVKPYAQSRIDSILTRAAKLGTLFSYLEVSERGLTRRIPVASILYLTSRGHAMEVHLRNHIFTFSSMSMSRAAALLPRDGQFFMCYRGILVNLDQIQVLENTELLLKTGERLPVSRLRQKEIQEAYTQRLFAQTRKEDCVFDRQIY